MRIQCWLKKKNNKNKIIFVIFYVAFRFSVFKCVLKITLKKKKEVFYAKALNTCFIDYIIMTQNFKFTGYLHVLSFLKLPSNNVSSSHYQTSVFEERHDLNGYEFNF